MKRAIWIMWPSFVIGGVAEALFFTLFDPMDMRVFGEPLALTPTATYTIGFFLFWAFAAGSSAFTCFLQRSSVDINRLCPLEPSARPPGCPKRDAGSCEQC